MTKYRVETDSLGDINIKKDMLWGIHTQRAFENFKLSNKKIPFPLISAYGYVKLACIKVNSKLGYIDKNKAKYIEQSCHELIEGKLNDYIIVHPLQGGAGTSTNLNISEVLANRTLQLMGKLPGEYNFCDPIEDINKHQSTNDTYPTALRIAVLKGLQSLEKTIIELHRALEGKETKYANILKIGRTELMDALPMTVGRSFGAWAEALSRDRWRIFKCTERARVINLGGTAIGSGLGAPRDYIFQVDGELRALTGLPLSRAENLIDGTQNQDALVEIMGIIKTHAMNLMKISGDLKLLAMGPDAGLQELVLPPIQSGSSIMPNKVNPVIPEMLTQVAIQVAASDQAISWAVGLGQLELNAFLPLVAINMLESLELLSNANSLALEKCFKNLQVNSETCTKNAKSSAAIATVLIPLVGYHQAENIAKLMKNNNLTLEQAANQIAGVSELECKQWLSPEVINALGFKPRKD